MAIVSFRGVPDGGLGRRRLMAGSAGEEIRMGACPGSHGHSRRCDGAQRADVKTNVAKAGAGPCCGRGPGRRRTANCSGERGQILFWPAAALTPLPNSIKHHIAHASRRTDAAELLREGLENRSHRYVSPVFACLACAPLCTVACGKAVPACPPATYARAAVVPRPGSHNSATPLRPKNFAADNASRCRKLKK